ncbi:MAG: ROK family protein [Candidatus Cyclobacteriaceae bacterium M3_2C_046]
MPNPFWGIDLGGTKIEGVVLESIEQPDPVSRRRVPTEAGKGYQHILDQVSKLIGQLSEEAGYRPDILGIGTPGTLDPNTGLLKNSNTTCLNGMPFRDDLEKILGIPIRMANDANCFALAETRLGTVAQNQPQAEVVFGVIMGTGVGGGLIVNTKPIGGKQGIGGEWGHNFLDESGGKCYCGKTGCVETVISGPGLQRYYEKLTTHKLTLPEILEKHQHKNDQNADLVVDRLLEMFGLAISVVINIVDPDVVVLGGGLGNIDLLYTRGVDQVKKHVFNNRLDTVFLKPALGDSAGVFGAAMLVAD